MGNRTGHDYQCCRRVDHRTNQRGFCTRKKMSYQYGTVEGITGNGITFQNGGTFINNATGKVTGGTNGIESTGSTQFIIMER